MPLNPEQQSAVDYLDGPLLVLAGPGTGKTELLSNKVAHILEATDTNPEDILCLTFTENGANEMRDRLFSKIHQAAGKVAIHTYHGFGSVILGAYKNYATNYDRRLDEPIPPVRQYKIISDIQQSLDGRDILRGDRVQDIVDTIKEAKSARLTADDLEKIAQDNLKTAEILNEKIQAPLKNLVPRMKVDLALDQVYRPLLEVLTSVANQPASSATSATSEPSETPAIPEPPEASATSEPSPFLAPGVFREVALYATELKKIIEAVEAEEKPKLGPLSKWKTDYLERDETGGYRFKNLIKNKKLLSLANVMRKYNQILEENGLFDFADMIEQSIQFLKTDEGFRLTLAERYQFILLDEFQDTNPSQAELIYLLAGDDRPSIMAVGDDDQAIYAFQGANASNLYDFQQHFGAKYINLTNNYRSTTEIVDLARRVADQISDSFSKSNNVPKILTAVRDCELKPTSQTQIERHEFLSADGEYFWMAGKIAELVKSGIPQSDIAIITPKHKYITPLLPYLKSHSEISIAYEKRENLFEDPAISELLILSRFIFELAEEKQPSFRLLQILSFPFFDLDPLAVATACARPATSKFSINSVQSVSMQPATAQASTQPASAQFAPDRPSVATPATLARLASAADPKIQALASVFAELVTLSYEAPLELFLDNLIEKTGFKDFYSKNHTSTFLLYEKLGAMKRALKDYLKADAPKLKDLITFVDDYAAANAPLKLTSPYSDSSDAVQIVTAHGSKGSQFKYVFMVAVDDLAWGNSKGNNNLLALPKNLEQIRHTGHTDDECLRLFFVALTRAKSYLYLTNSRVDFSGKSPARLEYLGEYEQDGRVLSPLLGTQPTQAKPDQSENSANTQSTTAQSRNSANTKYTTAQPKNPATASPEVILHTDLDSAKKQADLRLSWIAAYREKELLPQLKPLLQKNLERYALSASDLTSFIDVVYAGPEEFFKKRILRADPEPPTASALYGTLIHSTFEQVTTAHLDDTAALEFFKAEAEKLPLLEADKRALVERGLHGLEISLKTFSDILRDPTAKAEVNLKSEHLYLGDVPADGIIDHLKIDESAKTLEVYDFKTGNYKEKKWDSADATLYKYKLQLGFYKLLLNLSPTFSRYKVEKAHILFVSPDVNDRVYDKVYEYNEKDEAELKTLIPAVYRHIKSLDFLECDDLYLAPDSSKGIKDIKAFVQTLLETAQSMLEPPLK